MNESSIERATRNIEPLRQLATLKTAQARQRKAEAEAEAAEARVKRARAVNTPAKAQENAHKAGGKVYSNALAQRLLDRLAEGQSLRSAAAAEGVPCSTVRKWLKSRKDFAEAYKAAREDGYALLADDLLEAVNRAHDVACDPESGVQRVAACRLEVDTKKWLLSKMLPKVYGDRTQMEISGPDGESLLPKHTLEEDERFARLMAATAATIQAKEAAEAASDPPTEDEDE